ncbi:MAG: hypothetical protein NTZ27_11910 [Ignavibacteriales bacterium]|nr:hypothetical protein [Ignavibacteriales bacterium]
MLIVFHLVAMLFYSIFAGFGFVGFFSLSMKIAKRKEIWLVIPIAGYVLSQVLFFHFYKLLSNSTLSVLLTTFTVSIINFLYIFKERKNLSTVFSDFRSTWKKFDKGILLILFSIFILSSWQYIIIGEGHYYHSGNEDYFDGVYGGDLYYNNVPTKYIFNDLAGSVFYTAVIKYQYCSQAFWRTLIGLGGLDGFVLQEIFCLLLTSIGVFWLSKNVFEIKKSVALWITFWSVSASFYFSTFMTGHIGSIMYVSVIPVFLGISLLWIRKSISWLWILLLGLIYYFIDNTYPGPINLLLIPLVFTFIQERILGPRDFWSKIQKFLGINSEGKIKTKIKDISILKALTLTLLIIIGLIVSAFWLWDRTEEIRILAVMRTGVSWKISLFKEMIMIFWGIYPPGSVGTTSILPLFITNNFINNTALIFGISLSLIVLIAAFKLIKSKNKLFLFLYIMLFVPFLIVMRFFWGSPYYFYKFLYVHQFIIVIVLFIWLSEYPPTLKLWKRKFIFVLFTILALLNVLWNVLLGMDLLERPYHNKEKITDFFKNTSPEIISKSYLDIPNEVNRLAFQAIFWERKIQLCRNRNESEYIINLRNINVPLYNSVDTIKVLFDNGLLSISKNPHKNIMTITTAYEPNFSDDININWIGNAQSVLYENMKDEIHGILQYIKKNKLEKETFLDITQPDIYYLFFSTFKQQQINLCSDPAKSRYFIQIRGAAANITLTRSGTMYAENFDQSECFSNSYFCIKLLPTNNRKVNEYWSGKDNYVPIIKFISEHGKKVFLDFPREEPEYLFLKEKLNDLGIQVCEYPEETELILRFVFYSPFDEYFTNTISNKNEKIIEVAGRPSFWYSGAFNSHERLYDIELVFSPIKDRIIQVPSQFELPTRVRFSMNDNDFSLYIQNISKNAKYLRLLFSPGPSINYAEFDLKISDLAGFNKKFHISYPNTLIDLPLDQFKISNNQIRLKFTGEGLIGKSLLPLDERFLNYLLTNAELTSQIDEYSSFMKKQLNFKSLSPSMNYLSKFIQVPEPNDIISNSDTNRCSLGLGWDRLETSDGHPMRWAGKEPAEIVLDNIDKKHNIIQLDLEAGPGCGGKPLKLKIYHKNQLIKEEVVSGRKNIELQLPEEIYKDNKEQIILKLVAETENAKIASDPRVLNFRVFNISLKEAVPQQKTIVDKMNFDKISLGNGWYPFETYYGESFQWVGGKPAEIIFKNSDNNLGTLKLDLEPGPSCGGESLKLDIYLNDKLINENKLLTRKIFEINLKNYKNNLKDGNNVIKLVPSSKNINVPGDPRMLNFRVFSINYMQQ